MFVKMQGVWSRREREVRKAFDALWRQHMRTEFPGSLRGEELNGVDMVMLDADIAGCVCGWRAHRGDLDEDRQALLEQLIDDVDRVLPLLNDQDRAYYARLGEMGRLVANAVK